MLPWVWQCYFTYRTWVGETTSQIKALIIQSSKIAKNDQVESTLALLNLDNVGVTKIGYKEK